jgi:hypothetical protein
MGAQPARAVAERDVSSAFRKAWDVNGLNRSRWGSSVAACNPAGLAQASQAKAGTSAMARTVRTVNVGVGEDSMGTLEV